MTNKNRLILVSNDDGIDTLSVKILADEMRQFGEVYVVAPNEGQSGKSQALTFNSPVKFVNEIDEKDYKVFRLWGTPVDCVKMAFDKILPRKPDLIVSGINYGSNSSTSSIYSGTVAVAREGCLNRVSSIAFSSLDDNKAADYNYLRPLIHQITQNVIEHNLPIGTFLNVNFPKQSAEEIRGIKICRNAKGIWHERFIPCCEPEFIGQYLLTGDFENEEPNASDTDEWALNHNWASIVPLQTDATDFNCIEIINRKYIFNK